jgi:hypothetical protein
MPGSTAAWGGGRRWARHRRSCRPRRPHRRPRRSRPRQSRCPGRPLRQEGVGGEVSEWRGSQPGAPARMRPPLRRRAPAPRGGSRAAPCAWATTSVPRQEGRAAGAEVRGLEGEQERAA